MSYAAGILLTEDQVPKPTPKPKPVMSKTATRTPYKKKEKIQTLDDLLLTGIGAARSVFMGLQAGLKLWAVQKNIDMEVLGYARLTIDKENGNLLIHGIQKEGPAYSPDIRILDYAAIRETVDKTPQTFIDLKWPGSKGEKRVFIQMIGETKRGKQFVLLVTGEKGSSYVGLNFEHHINKGRVGEALISAAYDGDKAKALIKNLTKNGEYYHPRQAGLVTGGVWAKDKDDQNALFTIKIQSTPDVFDCLGFGHVIEGMEHLEEAALNEDIEEVVIQDCGIVVPPALYMNEDDEDQG